MNPDSPRHRLGIVGLAALALFAALFARLWFLQVMTAPEFRVAAESNRIRTVALQAPRGRILDRNGEVIVGNRRAIVVSVDWQEFIKLSDSEADTLLRRLANEINRYQPDKPRTDVEQLRKRLEDPRFSRFKPVPVAQDVPEELEVFLAEHADRFPTVRAERVTVRSYPYGQLLAHVLGYVGPVNEEDLEESNLPSKPYARDDDIGRGGVEGAMEAELRGVPGFVEYEVDARNRPIRELDAREPVPGNDVRLTIDIDVQALAEEALAAELERARGRPDTLGYHKAPAGSTVVIDPRNGQVIAMASNPTYFPGEFINGINSDRWDELNDPELHTPLTNRAIAGQYAPGSTFKLFTAYAGLTKGIITPQTTINDPGFYRIPNCAGGGRACERQNAGRQPNGAVSLQRAITVSSDVYFYSLGNDFWARRGQVGEAAMQEQVDLFGFGQRSGIPLVGEAAGRIPTPAWKAEYVKATNQPEENGTWFTGDNLNVAIGQGDVLVTPLQLANGYAVLANGGKLYRPQLVLTVNVSNTEEVKRIVEPEVIREIPFDPATRDIMLAGFAGVTTSGTAATTFEGFPQDTWPVAGKTGTAQVNGKSDTSLFVGYGPTFDTQYVAVAVLEEAGNGGSAAAPTVRRILEKIALDQVPPAPPLGVIDPVEAAEEDAPPPSEGID